MLKTLLERGYKNVQSAFASESNAGIMSLKKPAIVLVFLSALAIGFLLIRGNQSLQSQSDYTAESAVNSETSATEQSTIEVKVDDSEASGGESNNSIVTRTSIDNGQATVELEVNGEEIPVDQDGTTHEVIQDESGSRTTIDVNVHSSQSSSTSTNQSNDSDSRIRFQSNSEIDINN